MCKIIKAVWLCVALVLLITTTALAGESYTETMAKMLREGNGNQCKATINDSPEAAINLLQTKMQKVCVQPDYEATVPLTFLFEYRVLGPSNEFLFNPVLDDFSARSEVLSLEINKNVAAVTIDLLKSDGSIITLFQKNTGAVYGIFDNYHVQYDDNGYSIQNDLVVELPQSEGVVLNLDESRAGHYVFDIEEGDYLPIASKWKQFVGDRKVKQSAVDVTYAKEKGKGFLPTETETLLAEHPDLANRCLVTVMWHDVDTKTTHYALVEGRWK